MVIVYFLLNVIGCHHSGHWIDHFGRNSIEEKNAYRSYASKIGQIFQWNDSPTQNASSTEKFLRAQNRFSGSHVNKTYYERESNNELISEQMILQIIRQKPNYSGFYFDKSANRYSHAILSLSYKASFPVIKNFIIFGRKFPFFLKNSKIYQCVDQKKTFFMPS